MPDTPPLVLGWQAALTLMLTSRWQQALKLHSSRCVARQSLHLHGVCRQYSQT